MIIEARGDVIKLKGALVENQWPAIKSSVSLLLAEHPDGVVIDATGLTEVSEPGARTFIEASNFIQSHNARVVVAGLQEDILEEIKQIPGVRSQLVVASTVEEARSSLQSGGMAGIPSKRARPVVLVPLIGDWKHALQHAATEAAARRAEIHLLSVLQIPRNQPLGVPMPELEQEAQHELSIAESTLKRSRVPVRKLTTRAREAIEGIARFATESKPELLVVAYTKEEMAKEGGRFTPINVLCEAPCDVALYCVEE